jgi:hypothetical protein
MTERQERRLAELEREDAVLAQQRAAVELSQIACGVPVALAISQGSLWGDEQERQHPRDHGKWAQKAEGTLDQPDEPSVVPLTPHPQPSAVPVTGQHVRP